ncbi:MAG: iron ABC transporter permease [Pseudomonadota bacterium]
MRRSLRSAGGGPWTALAVAIAVPTLLPLLVIAGSFSDIDPAFWSHLRQYVLVPVVENSLWLVAGVAVLATALGTTLAWLTAACEFPGRRVFQWALLLPMAMPGYVTAFVAIGTLEYAGPVQTALRELAGGEIWFPAIRSRGGVIAVMSLALYPYVYLLARNAFLTQGREALEAAQVLGMNRRRGFFRVALPMARPWIAAGAMLVVMETLADFGTVAAFNYDTFTTAIYETWFGEQSVNSALQLSACLLAVVLLAAVAERRLRGGRAFTGGKAGGRRIVLGRGRWAAAVLAGTVLTLGFVAPFVQLVLWSAQTWSEEFSSRYLGFAGHSLLLAGSAALLVTTVALLLGYARRNASGGPANILASLATRIATLGYALPGTVLAVGIFAPLAALNGLLNTAARAVTGTDPGWLVQATLATMLIAYAVRFLAVAHAPVDSNLLRITEDIDRASKSLGVAGWSMLRRVHAPMLRGGLATALVLVFVDVMKEMPITLMTRPFGWQTLATRVFEMTSEGLWERAALPAIAIVLVGLVPVILISRRTTNAF